MKADQTIAATGSTASQLQNFSLNDIFDNYELTNKLTARPNRLERLACRLLCRRPKTSITLRVTPNVYAAYYMYTAQESLPIRNLRGLVYLADEL